VNAVIFLALVYAGAWLGKQQPQHGDLPGARYVAAAVMIYFTLIGPVFLWIAIRPGGGKWRDVWHVYFAPTLAATVAIGVAVIAGKFIQQMPMQNDAARQSMRILAITLWTIVLYIPMIRLLSPAAFKDLMSRLSGVLRSKMGKRYLPESPAVAAAPIPDCAEAPAAAVTAQHN
jgi:spore maturation protein SpmA